MEINMKTVAFHNLGCKVNSYELDIMQQILTGKGYKVVPFDKRIATGARLPKRFKTADLKIRAILTSFE